MRLLWRSAHDARSFLHVRRGLLHGGDDMRHGCTICLFCPHLQVIEELVASCIGSWHGAGSWDLCECLAELLSF